MFFFVITLVAADAAFGTSLLFYFILASVATWVGYKAYDQIVAHWPSSWTISSAFLPSWFPRFS